jgi:hypothetical protein
MNKYSQTRGSWQVTLNGATFNTLWLHNLNAGEGTLHLKRAEHGLTGEATVVVLKAKDERSARKTPSGIVGELRAVPLEEPVPVFCNDRHYFEQRIRIAHSS